MKRISKKAEAHNKVKKKRISTLLIIPIVIAACVFCFAGYKLITIMVNYGRSSDTYDEIRKVVQQTDGTPSYAADDPDAVDYEPYVSGEVTGEMKNDPLIPSYVIKSEYEDEYDEGMVYNYQALHGINPDTIGYIKARGDGGIVDYPVVQGTDNDYYIDHMFNGQPNSAGSIFMDCEAALRFNSPYCIIYGHNMASGSRMFGYLKQYEGEKYHNSHLEYDVYSPYAHYVYKVIAAYKTDTYSLTYDAPVLYGSASMSSDEVTAALRELAENAISLSRYKTGFDVNEINDKSRLIALSTCYGSYSDPNRFVVLLIRDRIVIPRPTGSLLPEEATTSAE